MVRRREPEKNHSPEQRRAMLLGLGLDQTDEHVRITRGENFRLYGGSQETHEVMQEKVIKFNERLDSRGRRLEELSSEEFHDLAAEAGMNVPTDPPREA